MIALAITVLGFLLLAGLAALYYAAIHAPIGYEDELGFHEIVAPRLRKIPEMAEPASSHVYASAHVCEAP
jgi:hypothetical protein